MKRRRADDAAREKAMISFSIFIEKFADSFLIVDKCRDVGEDFGPAAPSLVAAVAGRKTATLSKRAGSLKSYGAWLAAQGWGPDAVMLEPALYGYLGHLTETNVGGTAGIALLAALNFSAAIFESRVPAPTRSARVRGLVTVLSRRRHCRGPRYPLSVAMLKAGA